MSITPLLYPLKASNPKLIMHMSLKPWKRLMKFPSLDCVAWPIPLRELQKMILWVSGEGTHSINPSRLLVKVIFLMADHLTPLPNPLELKDKIFMSQYCPFPTQLLNLLYVH